jgi:cytochrome c5
MTDRHRRAAMMVAVCALLAGCDRTSDAGPAPGAGSAVDPGEATWKRICAECHDGGLGDAPAIGDRDAWRPRLVQGRDVLLRHAIEGFTGAIGEMPPRGGDADLSDSQVEAALGYMIAKSGSPPE